MIPTVLYIGAIEIAGSDDHEGFVSAETADGGRTGIWTDARDAGPVAFRAACECGWYGDTRFPPDADGHAAALRAFVHDHFVPTTGAGDGGTPDPVRDFLPPWAAPVPAAEPVPV